MKQRIIKTYRHYGATSYDPNEFKSVRNRPCWNKPWHGLWASDIEAKTPWCIWCIREDFEVESLTKHFDFQLKPDARVLTIHNRAELEQFRRAPGSQKYYHMGDLDNSWLGSRIVSIFNFEALSEVFDAIEIMAGTDEFLYNNFYGWDCDSILILNKDIIVPIE